MKWLGVLIMLLLANNLSYASHESVGNEAADIIIETPLKKRFQREKKEKEYILFGKANLREALTEDFGNHGYRIHWSLPMDCINKKSKRYKGFFPEELLVQIGADYNIKFLIYRNKTIEATPLYTNLLAICGKNHRANLEVN